MRWLVVIGVLLACRAARADDTFYVEALGKGGLYGVGYEHGITKRLALGGASSFAIVDEQQVLTLAPYVHDTLLQGQRHAMFTEVGAVLAHSHLPSPVEGWDGMSEWGGGGFASLGWEYARRLQSSTTSSSTLVLRVAGSLVVGEGGIGPTIGFAVGARR